MKALALLFFFSSVGFAETYRCTVPATETPYDQFFIEFTGEETAEVYFKRNKSILSEEYSEAQELPGCESAELTRQHTMSSIKCGKSLYIGFVFPHTSGEEIYAVVVFYRDNIGYKAGKKLMLTCGPMNN